LHVSDQLASGEQVRAWRPRVPGVAEVFHAHFVQHAYPAHTHDTWTLLIVDAGAIRYDLDHTEHGAFASRVTLLPPYVAHNGRAAAEGGFRKRVCYLDQSVLDASLVSRVMDRPDVTDPLLRQRIAQLHDALDTTGEELEAESRLAFVAGRLFEHLDVVRDGPRQLRPSVAGELRDLLDNRLTEPLTLREAGAQLHAHPDHLVRCFTREFGLPPHRYVIGRRIEAARRLLLAGEPASRVATTVGFHDQAHLSRHFRAVLGVPPGRYSRSRQVRSAREPDPTPVQVSGRRR
jgi:AraC-like DNA-binding protein